MAYAHHVKLEPQHSHYPYYGSETTPSPSSSSSSSARSPWPSSPPLPDFAAAGRPHAAHNAAATTTTFLSSSMNFLAGVVADPSSGAAPAELFQLRPRDVDTVQSLVSVLAASNSSSPQGSGAGSGSTGPVADLPGGASPSSPRVASPLPNMMSSSSSFTIRPRALRRSKGTVSPGVPRHHQPQQPQQPTYGYHDPLSHRPVSPQHQQHHHHHQAPPVGYYHPYLNVVPVAPCHHHQQQHAHHHHQSRAHAHVSGGGSPIQMLPPHSPHSDRWSIVTHPQHHHAQQPHCGHHHLQQQHGSPDRPLFWSSSTGVVTRASAPLSRSMSGEGESELYGASSSTTTAAATSAASASAAAATALIRAHAQQLRKRRRSQSAPAPRDQVIAHGRHALRRIDAGQPTLHHHNQSDGRQGSPAGAYSPMAVSSPAQSSDSYSDGLTSASSPPSSPSTSSTKRSDIYGLLN